VALPTIDLMEITPRFIKDHIFIILLTADTAVTGFFNFSTGSNFNGIIGYVFSFVFGSLISVATGTTVEVRVDTWQIFFIFFIIQTGLLKLIFNILVSMYNE